ncbi:DUF4345 domain-containing protein [Dyadobacter sp. CY326]|uniref:DUF4345 domain-containing protein n=1 Tax=Dyadobacter sp. CY326 TaxID=2907300 RepID=UPI001F344887|nr:DUF4345 domain-containing protein [Dyadobacter sp. CY326]MCE7067006.1 DUF4345 domain-containing protein [Dyadobacter sp. CY326]
MMKQHTSRRALQCVMAVSACAPLLSGILGLSGIYNPILLEKPPENLILDSNLRFLNAMCVAVGLAFYFVIPVIEKETLACRIICFAVFFGGLGRVISIVDLGTPPVIFIYFLILELSLPILIIVWQMRVARAAQIND